MAREVRVGFKDYFLISIIYLAIALVMFWPVAINPAGMITGGVPNSIFQGSGDSYQNLWTLWWVNYAIFTLHVTPYFTHLLYAPIGASLVTETLSPFAALFSLPFQAVSLGFAYNVIFFLDFVLSGLFMFLLADHIVKNRYAAFIAGIVFAFSPFHLMHAGVGHLNWDSIQFLPLFVLLLLRMIEEKKAVYAAGAGVCLALVTFFGDPEQAIIALMFVVMFLLLKLSDKKYRESVLSARFAINSLVVIVVAAVICSPFLVPIAYGIAHGALAAANQYNTIKSYMISSNPILSFFLPSPYNNFFSWISASYSSVYVVNPTERVAYIGYAALALALLAIWGDRNGRFATTFAWVVIALFFAWLSLGPYVQLGSYSDPNSGSVPGIYPAITAIPIANLVREPARFEMVVTLALAILSAIGLKELFAIRKVKDSDAARYLTIIVAIIMLIEYNGIPITQSFINSYFFNLNISSGYNLIAQNSSNFAVMILPTIQNIGENPTVFHPQLYTGLSMYYQTVFRKPIIGGYTSRVNYTQQLQALEIPISVYGSFLQRGINFAYTSPVLENYSNLTLYWLGRYNVAYVPVIKGAYSQQNATVLDNALGKVFGAPYYEDNSTAIFSVSAAVSHSINRSIVAYPSVGSWLYGCTGDNFCDQNSGTYWWGTNVRGIDVFAPKNMTHALMTFTGLAYYYNPSMPITVFVNNTDAYYSFNLTLNSQTFTVPVNLTAGTTSILFYSPPGAGNNSTNNFNFGIKNITFIKR